MQLISRLGYLGSGAVQLGVQLYSSVRQINLVNIALVAKKFFSILNYCYQSIKPSNWYKASKVNADDTHQETQEKVNTYFQTAYGFFSVQILGGVKYLPLGVVKYLPIVLSPLTIGISSTIIDIATLAGSYWMFQAHRHQGTLNRHAPFFQEASRATFALGYLFSALSTGLDLATKLPWTFALVPCTGTIVTICGIAATSFFIIATIFDIIQNFNSYKATTFWIAKETIALPGKGWTIATAFIRKSLG